MDSEHMYIATLCIRYGNCYYFFPAGYVCPYQNMNLDIASTSSVQLYKNNTGKILIKGASRHPYHALSYQLTA